jgi:colicin import membrane protein
MHAADSDDRLAFAPPPPPGLLRAFVLAVIAHLLLLLALTYGLRWQRETPVVAAEAELWSRLPQEAAPKEVPVPPPPPPAPPVVKAPPLPDPQVQRDAEIALEREREKREAAERRQAELEKERDRKRKLEAKRKRDEELARQQQEKLDKQEQARLQAEAKRKDDEKKRRQQEQQEKKLAQLREENLRRIQGMAGSGAPSATGTAAKSSGPSASWAGRVQGRVRPNIVFTEDIPGNPEAIVAVRLAPDGTIVSKRIKKSSGNKGWDDAVLRALDKTEVLPRDTDGRAPPEGDLVFKPKG